MRHIETLTTTFRVAPASSTADRLDEYFDGRMSAASMVEWLVSWATKTDLPKSVVATRWVDTIGSRGDYLNRSEGIDHREVLEKTDMWIFSMVPHAAPAVTCDGKHVIHHWNAVDPTRFGVPQTPGVLIPEEYPPGNKSLRVTTEPRQKRAFKKATRMSQVVLEPPSSPIDVGPVRLISEVTRCYLKKS